MRRLGILLSGRGSNFLAIHGHIAAGRLDAEIAGVVSDQPDAPGLARARELGLPAFCVERAGRTKGEFEDAIARVLEAQAVELVCLAGFMRVLGPGFIRRFPQRILNILLVPLSKLMPAWYALLIVVRELAVTALRSHLEGGGQAFGAKTWGKAKMLAQCITVPAVLVYEAFKHEVGRAGYYAVLALLGVTLVLTLVSGLLYLKGSRLDM